MNLSLFNRWAICVMFGSWGRYALIPYIEYDKLSNRLLFCFWKWHIVVDAERIKKGGEK